MAAEDWITLEEAAEKLHVVIDTMRRWVRLGHFSHVKVGKRYLVKRQAIDDYLDGRVEHGPASGHAAQGKGDWGRDGRRSETRQIDFGGVATAGDGYARARREEEIRVTGANRVPGTLT